MTVEITTSPDGVIQLPTYKHVTDPWAFALPDDTGRTLIFKAHYQPLQLSCEISLRDTDDMPTAALMPDATRRIMTDAEQLFDLEWATAHGFADWLHDCAEAFDWLQTLAAEGRLLTLIAQQSIKRFQESHHDDTDTTEELPQLPMIWADAGMDCLDDEDGGKVFEFTGGVGVPETNVCAVTRERYTVNDEGCTTSVTDSFELQGDPLPLEKAYPTAAAIALAAAGIEANAPTPSADEVNGLAQLLHGFALDCFIKGGALHE